MTSPLSSKTGSSSDLPLLRAEGISRSYPKKAEPALAVCDVTIGSGETIALVGHNGAGKSTFLDILGGLAKPDTGRVQLGLPTQEVGWCPQREIIDWSLTVKQNIALGLALRRRLSHGRRSELILGVSETLRLTPYLDRTAEGLSGGELRRTQIARALAGEPAFLVLDEPTTGLDPEGIGIVFDYLAQRRTHGASAIISTHETSRFARYCTRVIALDRGRIIADEPVEKFIARTDDHDDLWAAYTVLQDEWAHR
ncbi:Lipopolysaccharide export system ATP-binding protein LptB [Frondihabitans sp. 762G35]|uniref:ATP-binding cassette domain-containing protein n=1 Tax=Frondihabitans sp. 762G35 TaxID=1446794 RepID=UPI000D224EF0|nr:ABC transporter ATP-binding protein [Frondihabitans sp. 762G35]ARC55790.1 Lipopolysaccharide export system ATP-binding protein LptB [Frondihabitans sp. 762G35]